MKTVSSTDRVAKITSIVGAAGCITLLTPIVIDDNLTWGDLKQKSAYLDNGGDYLYFSISVSNSILFKKPCVKLTSK